MRRWYMLVALLACDARARNVHYEPSPPEVVDVMVQLAHITPADVVYDLGCGDGRVVIRAAQLGARGVCVEIDPIVLATAKLQARAAGVYERIRFVEQDLRTIDVGDATVVMLYLSQALDLVLRPKLQATLKPGARIVSHWHDMGDWAPAKTVRVKSDGWVRPIYLWTIQ